MKKIQFTDDHRQKHYDFFRQMDQPHFGVTSQIDITDFLSLVRRSSTLRFTPAIVYLITRTAHEIPVFRWRIRGEEIVEHLKVRPSFTVPTRSSDVFSFCTVTYDPDPYKFHQRAVEEIEKMQDDPNLEDEPHADDYLFLSAFPWASFTSVQHAMHNQTSDSVPRIVWGKYYNQGDRVLMPVAVQAHHALVDGSDLGKYFIKLEQLLRSCEDIFKINS